MSEPYAFITNTGSSVLKTTLDQYAIKSPTQDNTKDPFTFIRKDAENPDSKQAPEVGVSSYGAYGLVKPPYNPKLLANLPDLNTYHSACLETKANDIGGLGCTVEPVGDDYSQSHIDDVQQFLNNCKPFIEEILINTAYDLENIGQLGMELIREGGLQTAKPHRLEHVHSHTIRIHKDKNKFMQTWDGVNNRWFKKFGYKKDVHITTGQESELGSLKPEEAANELLYATNYTSKSSFYGRPRYIPAIRTMLGDQSAVEYNLVFFKNFGIPAYAVFVTGYFDDKELLDDNGAPTGKTVIQDKIERKFEKVKRNKDSSMIFMIPSGSQDSKIEVRFEKLATEQKDSSFRLYRLDARDEVIASHGMDPHQIGVNISGPLGGDTAKQSDKNYKNRIVLPRQKKLENLLNDIVWDEEFGFGYTDVQIVLKSIDTDDDTSEYEIDKQMVLNGTATPKQVIMKWSVKRGFKIDDKLLDDPALNNYYLPNNMNPITYVGMDLPVIDEGTSEEAAGVPEKAIKVIEDLKRDLLEERKRYESQTPANQ